MGGRITRFKGPVQTGQFQGLVNDPVWDAEMVKRISCSTASPSVNATLPDSNIMSFLINVEVAIGGTAANQGVVKLGVTGDKTRYGKVEAISAVGTYPITSVSGLALLGLVSGANLVVISSVAAGAIGSGGVTLPQFSLYTRFQQLENLGNS